jgi:transmembrane sensor
MMVLAAAAVVIAGALFFRGGWTGLLRSVGSWSSDPAPLEVAGDPALDEGRWLQVAADRPLQLRFADGSEFRLEPRSTGRLAKASTSEARLTLESGKLAARVAPAASTGRSWSITAGPYRVRVIGTELQVDWDAPGDRFSVRLLHGRVEVRGGALEPAGVLLESGDRLHVQDGRVEIQRARLHSSGTDTTPGPAGSARELTRSDEPTPKAAAPATRGPAIEKPSGAASAAPAPVGSSEAAPDDWKSLARAGEYRPALTAAERQGFEGLVERLDAADLALLADAARLAGNGARARQALLGLRRRFPGASAAQTGAFRLGRLAFAERSYAEAATWFEAYLRAAPGGALASEAAGRLIEARARGGDRAGAETAARDYLRRFPGGPYEALARGLLRGDKLAPK